MHWRHMKQAELTRLGKVFTMLDENGALSLWYRKTTEEAR